MEGAGGEQRAEAGPEGAGSHDSVLDPVVEGAETVAVSYDSSTTGEAGAVGRWLGANEGVVAEAGRVDVHFAIAELGPEYRKASSEALGPFGRKRSPAEDSGGAGGDCPLCGTGYAQSLAVHLERCPASGDVGPSAPPRGGR
jgi:hypothetical protein